MQSSPRFKDGVFRNTAKVGPGLKGNPLPTLGEYFFGADRKLRMPPGPLPIENPLEGWAQKAQTPLRVTWLGHSTVLLDFGGVKCSRIPSLVSVRLRRRSRARSGFTPRR